MICPQCNTENVEGASFCSNCGFALTPIGSAEAGGAEAGGLQEVALRPSNLGGLLNLTFGTYQRGFKGLFGIAIVGQLVLAVVGYFIGLTSGIPFGTFPFEGFGFDISEWPARFQEGAVAGNEPRFSLLYFPLWLVSFLFTLVMTGAIIHATVVTYVGRGISLGDSYGVATRRVVFVVIGGLVLMLLALPVMFVFALLTAIASALLGWVGAVIVVLGIMALWVFLMVSFIFYVPVVFIERLGPMDALGRSWGLVGGKRWWILGVGFVFFILFLILAIFSNVPAFILSLINGYVGTATGIVIGALIFPLYYIAVTVLYLELRIRKERLTLVTLAADLDGAGAVPEGT